MSNRTRWMAGAAVLALAMGVAHAGSGHGGHGGHWGGQQGGMQMLKQADANGDGQTTLAEAQAKVLERATAIDGNKDGAITPAELQAHREQMRAERRAARLAAMDADKNGAVSVEEFAAVHSERLARFDRNGDGILDADDHPRGYRHGDERQRN